MQRSWFEEWIGWDVVYNLHILLARKRLRIDSQSSCV